MVHAMCLHKIWQPRMNKHKERVPSFPVALQTLKTRSSVITWLQLAILCGGHDHTTVCDTQKARPPSAVIHCCMAFIADMLFEHKGSTQATRVGGDIGPLAHVGDIAVADLHAFRIPTATQCCRPLQVPISKSQQIWGA